MKIYKISCFSKCGSYFAAYLQAVMVIADNEEEALKEVDDKYSDEFISKDREVELICDKIESGQIINTHYDSDY